jgi:hypothetical protein
MPSLVALHVVVCVTFVLCAAILEGGATRPCTRRERSLRFRKIFEHNIIPTAIWHGGTRLRMRTRRS